MGCWNGTCMISNLPIISGDEVKLVLMRKSYDYEKLPNCGGYVYSAGAFSPAFLSINAKYNDYGSVENIVEDKNFQVVTEYFKKKYEEVEIEEEKIKDFNLQMIIDGIERGSFRILDKGDTTKKNGLKNV